MTTVGIISTDESQLFEFGLSVPARSIKNNEKNHIFHENDSKSEKSTKNEDFMELKYEFAETFQMTPKFSILGTHQQQQSRRKRQDIGVIKNMT